MSHQDQPINFHHNPTDYCMKWLWWCYIKDRLSVSSKPTELFFHYCFEGKAGQKSSCYPEQHLHKKQDIIIQCKWYQCPPWKEIWCGGCQWTHSYGLFPFMSVYKNEKGWDETALCLLIFSINIISPECVDNLLDKKKIT